MALAPTPENFRMEIARHRLSQRALAASIGMNPDQLRMILSEAKPLYRWAAHNIGLSINQATGTYTFAVNTEIGLLPPPPRGRPRGYTQPESIDPMRRPA